MVDLLEQFGVVKALVGMAGLSGVGAVVVALKLRKAAKEVSEAVAKTRWAVTKYSGFIQSEMVSKDMTEVKKEIDEAFEAVADVVEKFHKGAARRLRAVI